MGGDTLYEKIARDNVAHGRDTTPAIVKRLLDKIDQQAREIYILSDDEEN